MAEWNKKFDGRDWIGLVILLALFALMLYLGTGGPWPIR